MAPRRDARFALWSFGLAASASVVAHPQPVDGLRSQFSPEEEANVLREVEDLTRHWHGERADLDDLLKGSPLLEGLATSSSSELSHMFQQRIPADLVWQVLEMVPVRYQFATSRRQGQRASVTLWGKEGPRHTLKSRVSKIVGVSFFPCGESVLTWADSGEAVVWDTGSGRGRMSFDHGGLVSSARIFPAGDRLVTCGAMHGCKLWSTATGQLLRVFEIVLAVAVEVFQDGDRLLALGMDSSVKVWDTGTGKELCHINDIQSAIKSYQLFPDGERLATGSIDGSVGIWNVSNCRALHTMALRQAVYGVAAVRGGLALAVITSGGGATVWDAMTGEMLTVLTDPPAIQMSVVSSTIEALPPGDRLLTANSTGVTIWNVTSGEVLHTLLSAPHRTSGVAIAPGGDVVVTCGSRHIMVWDTASGAMLHRFEDHAAANGDSCLVAVGFGGALDPKGFGEGLSWYDPHAPGFQTAVRQAPTSHFKWGMLRAMALGTVLMAVARILLSLDMSEGPT